MDACPGSETSCMVLPVKVRVDPTSQGPVWRATHCIPTLLETTTAPTVVANSWKHGGFTVCASLSRCSYSFKLTLLSYLGGFRRISLTKRPFADAPILLSGLVKPTRLTRRPWAPQICDICGAPTSLVKRGSAFSGSSKHGENGGAQWRRR